MTRQPHPNRKPGEIPHLMVRGDGVVVNRCIHKEGEPSPVPGIRMVPDPGGTAEFQPRRHTLKQQGNGKFVQVPHPPAPPSDKEIEYNGPKDIAMRLTEVEKRLEINPERKPPEPTPPDLPTPSVE